MNSIKFSFGARRSAVALAVAVVCLGAQAQSAKVETTVNVGLAAVDGSRADRAQFDQYRALQNNSTQGLLGIDYSLRDEDAGKSVDLTGSNLLSESRELNFVWKHPGSWKFTANYGELVRQEPNTINSASLGLGTTLPTVNKLALSGTGTDITLQTKRTGMGLGFTRIISPALQFEVNVKTEAKDGSRLFGSYLNCATPVNQTLPSCATLGAGTLPMLLLPEPIKSNHTQVETRLGYSADKLRLSLGYYGSFYRNSNAALNPSGLVNLVASETLLALPPDNEAHQFDLSGSYDLAPSTRAALKLGYATVLQRANFVSPGVVNNLDAQVITTSAKLGVTSRPMPKLSLLADFNYQNKDDRTPLFNYNLVGTNRHLPNLKIQSKLQASWQFSPDYRGTAAVEHEFINRGTFTTSGTATGISALRQITDETTLRADLRRQMANNVSGSVGISSSQRDGSNWAQPSAAGGLIAGTNPALNAVFMPTLADRQRNKVKLSADWQASEQLSLQFNAENGSDNYTAPNANGLRDTRVSQFGLDWSYAISDDWAMTGYLAQSTQTLNQSRYLGSVMAFDNTNVSASLGVTGKASSKVQVGANVSYMDDNSVYAQSTDGAARGLPDINYRQTALKLFANYQLEKTSSVRLDLVHQRNSSNDWTWGTNGAAFTYADNTTVSQNPNQSVNFIGVSYVLKLQ